MRFDLEVNIVSQLTSTGLKKLSSMFYDTTSDNKIAPIQWDVSGTVNPLRANAGGINTANYLGLAAIPDNYFTSGVKTTADLNLRSLMIRENIICPLFDGGDVMFYRYDYRWSRNNITKKSTYADEFGVYVCDLDADVDPASVQVFTLKLSDPGYIGYYRNFSFVDSALITFSVINKIDLPQRSELNTIYACRDTCEVFESTQTGELRCTFIGVKFLEYMPIVPAHGDAVVINEVGLFLNVGNVWKDIIADRVFKTSKADYKFTIKPDPFTGTLIALINSPKIMYFNQKIGTAPAGMRGLAGLTEFPINSIDIQGLPNYRVLNSAVLVTNDGTIDKDIVASYDIVPMVTYQQTGRIGLEDVVYQNINITPSAIKFKSGLICAYNTFAPTLDTAEGGHIPIPLQLSITTDKSEISITEGVKVTATITGIDNIPIKGAKVSLSITNKDQDVVKWLSGDGITFDTYTGLDGTSDAILMSTRGRYGWYIQKEWVSGKSITIPFDIMTEDASRCYLYIITADDPILGKLNARADKIETNVFDYYTRAGRIDSYECLGRKIAYITMSTGYTGSQKFLRSSFIKPNAVMPITNDTIWLRNAYIKGLKDDPTVTLKTIMDYQDASQFTFIKPTSLDNTHTDIDRAKGWDPLWLVSSNAIESRKVEFAKGSRLIYDDIIPGQDVDRVVGYWLITGNSGSVDVKATFEDDNTGIKLTSDSVSLLLTNYIKSEYEFLLGGDNVTDQNTTLGIFGYYTVSEYMNNPMGVNSCGYYCKNSDASIDTGNKCRHQNLDYRKFYLPDNAGLNCIRTPEWEKQMTLNPVDCCPGLSAAFINPFILLPEK